MQTLCPSSSRVDVVLQPTRFNIQDSRFKIQYSCGRVDVVLLPTRPFDLIKALGFGALLGFKIQDSCIRGLLGQGSTSLPNMRVKR